MLSVVCFRLTNIRQKAPSRRLGLPKYVSCGGIKLKKSNSVGQFVVPSMALEVIDRAMQSFGAEGVSQDTNLASSWAGLRTLRIADVRISLTD